MPSAVSFRYATALADTISSPGAGKAPRDPKSIAEQLAEFSELYKDNNELRIVFSTPAVSVEKKKAILASVASGAGIEPLTKNFLNVVIDHDRIGLVGEISEAFQSILNDRLGSAVAEVSSTRPLDDRQKQQLSEALRAKTGKQVQMTFSSDPSLIGGVVVRIGSTIYDGSVRGSLDRLRTRLTES